MNKENLESKINRIQLFYNITIEDIRFSKRQQWNVTYYSLLLLGAIILTFLRNSIDLIRYL